MNAIVLKLLIIFIIYVVVSKHVLKEGSKFYNNRSSATCNSGNSGNGGDGGSNDKVYDVSFKYLPNLFEFKKYKDLVFLALLFPLLKSQQIWNTTIQIIGLFLSIVLIRCISIMVTILPKTTSKCKDKYGLFGTCYDLIFSGHFAVGLTSTLVLLERGLIQLPFLVLFNLLNAFLILVTRSHYTIDILVSLVVTLFVYQNNLSVL